MSPRRVSVFLDGTNRTDMTSWLGPMFGSPYPPDFCYLCERTGADSEEHVIARGFFGGTTNEIPRLRAHKGCNNKHSEAEEYVRNVLVQPAAAKGKVWEAAAPKVLGALGPKHRRPSGQRKFKQQLRETPRGQPLHLAARERGPRAVAARVLEDHPWAVFLAHRQGLPRPRRLRMGNVHDARVAAA